MEDTTNPEYNQEFSYKISKDELWGKVLKLSLMDHDGGSRKVIGLSVLALDSCGLVQGEGELHVKEMWLNVQEKVTEELSNLLSDRFLDPDLDSQQVSLNWKYFQAWTFIEVRHWSWEAYTRYTATEDLFTTHIQ